MGKIVGAVDLTVRLVETVIQASPAFKFQSASGKELSVRDLAGLARSIQAATSVPQGLEIHESDLKSLEARFAVVEAGTKAMLIQLATAPMPKQFMK
jgi:hypothetical protein